MVKICEICGILEGQPEGQSEELKVEMEIKKNLHLCENCRQELQSYE